MVLIIQDNNNLIIIQVKNRFYNKISSILIKFIRLILIKF